MSRFDYNSVLEDLDTNQVEIQVTALDRATEIVNSIAEKAVEALKRGPNRFLIAERLRSLGSSVVPHLEELLKNSDNSEVRILAALILLQFNSNIGVPFLLDAVAEDEEYAGLAASHLAKVGIKQAIEPIINRLRNCNLKQVDLVVSLLDALAKLSAGIPFDLRQRLSAADTPWQIRTIYTTNFASVPNPESRHFNLYQQWIHNSRIISEIPFDLRQRLSAADTPGQTRTIYPTNFVFLQNLESNHLNSAQQNQMVCKSRKITVSKWSYTSALEPLVKPLLPVA